VTPRLASFLQSCHSGRWCVSNPDENRFYGKDTEIMPVAEILESHMAYAEAGDGDAVVVFLHGNRS